jgi:hypothetical protein
MKTLLWGLLAAGLTAMAPEAAAADVSLKISNGRVWLVARDATAGQILSEWARIGQTTIVNGDRVPGGPLTLQLDNVSEEEALDLLLRTTAGFMGARRGTPTPATSAFDRIFILPAGSAGGTPVSAPPPLPVITPPPPVFDEPEFPPAFTPGVERIIGPDGLPVPDDQEGAPEGPAPVVDDAPAVPVGVPVPGMVLPAPRPPTSPPDAR